MTDVGGLSWTRLVQTLHRGAQQIHGFLGRFPRPRSGPLRRLFAPGRAVGLIRWCFLADHDLSHDRLGIATLCVSGGLGTAVLVERAA